MKKLLSIAAFLIISQAYSQVSVRDSSISMPIVYGFYSYQIPGGDLADRFGHSSSIGAGFMFKAKSNWTFGIEYGHIWWNEVKNGDSILKHILTEDGQIIDIGGLYAVFDLFGRGFTITGQVGKLIPVLSHNDNSGILLKAGIGYMQHWVRIQVKEQESVPWLSGDYVKGYDRLSSGLTLNQFIGYSYIGNSRVWNFYGGFEFTQGFTRNQRDIDFDTRIKDDKSRVDLIFGIKIGWMIPVYRNTKSDFYYY